VVVIGFHLVNSVNIGLQVLDITQLAFAPFSIVPVVLWLFALDNFLGRAFHGRPSIVQPNHFCT